MDALLDKKMEQSVNTIMSPCPLRVHPETSFLHVLERYAEQGNLPLIVVNQDGTLAGVITPMDLISALTPGDGSGGRFLISELDRILKSTAQNAQDLISDESNTVPENAKIRDALQAMEHGHTSSVIIVNKQNAPVGCINLADIIAYLIQPEAP